MQTKYQILASQIGSKTNIPNWPTTDLDGLFQALKQWTLSPNMDMSGDDPNHPHARFQKPFRGLAWGNCIREPIPEQNSKSRYVGTKPIHEDHPEAVRFCGNFMSYSFGFFLDTEDQALIAELDRLIAENMARPEYIEACSKHSKWA